MKSDKSILEPMHIETIVQFNNVSYQYGSREKSIAALKSVSFDIIKREFLTIIGPSGCGKTTLLNLLSSIIAPTSGEISLNYSGLNSPRFGVVFQGDVLLPWRDVIGNVKLPLEILGVNYKKAKERSLKYLELVGLLDFQNAYPKELSGGMKQRVGIARALVSEPSILLMDEPFSALDEITRTEMNYELQQIWTETGKTIIFVTHNINEAVFLSDRVITLTNRPGQIGATIEINLPRPRTLDTLCSRDFFDLTSLVRNSLNGSKGDVI